MSSSETGGLPGEAFGSAPTGLVSDPSRRLRVLEGGVPATGVVPFAAAATRPRDGFDGVAV